MSKTATHTLFDIAVQMLGKLPEQTRESISREVLERVESCTNSQLTDEQQAIVDDRMSRPRTHASGEAVQALFRRFESTA